MAIKLWKSDSLGITIEIDYDKCKGHGNCLEECPSEVFYLVDDKATCPGIDDCIKYKSFLS
jgi:NAD-dependent dihydropyrimidine dehydrogenase PreA subunit